MSATDASIRAELDIRALAAADIPAVAALARVVWQDAYPAIIPQAQIDYMLGQRYSDAALSAYLNADDRWFEVAKLDGALAGFCACELHQGEYKLDKLYIDPAKQRGGLGGILIARAADRARLLGHRRMILAVNKHNARAMAAYRKHGFSVRESVYVEIGCGFAMDDYIMEKAL